jgi:hypothetical protein
MTTRVLDPNPTTTITDLVDVNNLTITDVNLVTVEVIVIPYTYITVWN